MKKKISLWFISTVIAVSSYAQDTLSLKQCIGYGLQNHLSIKVYENNIRKTQAQAQENYSGYLPQISANGQFTDNLKLQTTVLPAGVFGPTEEKIQFGTRYTTTVSGEIDQTLYDQTLITAFKELSPGLESAKLNAAQNEETVIYNISNYYYQAQVYKQQLALLYENQIKYEKLQQITKLQIDKGVAKKVDGSRIEVNLNNTKSQISQTQNSYDLMLNRLKNAMGMAMNQPLLISVSIPDGTGALSNIPGLGDEFRPENRADFKSEMLNITIQYQEKQRVLAGYAPKLTAYAQLGAQAFGNQFDQSFKDWYDYSAIGLKLQVPIFDGLYKRAKTNEAKVTLDNAKKNLELDRQSFSLDYQNSTNQLKSNSDNVENDKQNLALAREVYSNTTLQYQEGTATLTDLLNDESSLKNAQTNYVTSLLNYYIAKLNLEKSKGTLKNYYQSLNK